MSQYIAFLRGINVSGKNKVSMPILKSAFEDQGLNNVQTYINSGNVLFSSNADNEYLKTLTETIILNTFDLNISVVVIAVNELIAAINRAPEWWGDGNKDVIHYAIFLVSPITLSEVCHAVGEIKPEFETIAYDEKMIFWSAPRETFNKSQWSKIASSTVNMNVTIRNANTVRKMIDLAQ